MGKRKFIGKPPKYCPTCGGNGKVFDTRQRDGSYLWRRHECAKRHRWSSIEIYVEGTGMGGTGLKDTAIQSIKRVVLSEMISRLQAEMPACAAAVFSDSAAGGEA